MNEIELSPEAAVAMRAHSRTEYPRECCGFLVAEEASQPRFFRSIERAANGRDGGMDPRFEIRPEDLRRLERRLEGTGMMVGGFYHSHPDQPAYPSAIDAASAWPWYTHVILRVTPRTVGPIGAFQCDPELGQFEPAHLTLRKDPRESALGRDSKNLLDESEET